MYVTGKKNIKVGFIVFANWRTAKLTSLHIRTSETCCFARSTNLEGRSLVETWLKLTENTVLVELLCEKNIIPAEKDFRLACRPDQCRRARHLISGKVVGCLWPANWRIIQTQKDAKGGSRAPVLTIKRWGSNILAWLTFFSFSNIRTY